MNFEQGISIYELMGQLIYFLQRSTLIDGVKAQQGSNRLIRGLKRDP